MLNALAFEIGIKESKTSELNSIVSRLNQLSGKTVTIDVKGVPELNQLLNRLGHDSNGITFKLPDLSQFLEQVKSVKSATDSLFSKQNAGDIPAFQSALSQMRELSQAIEKLKNENLSLQTGHSSDIFNRIQKMGTALNSAFSELPNTNIQSMTGYMKELTAEYLRFINSLEKKGGMKNFSSEAQTEISKVMRMFDQLNSVGTDSSALKHFQQQVRAVASIIIESMGNVVKEINAVKTAIQHDNFTAMSERIKKAAESIQILDENFKKFHLTIGQDEGMRNFMTGLGEVIRNVRATMQSLNLTGGDTGVNALTNTIKSIERAKYALYELDKLIHNANTSVKVGNEFGGDTTKLQQQIQKMREFRAELDIIAQTGYSSKGLSASDFLNTADFKIAKDQLTNLIREQERWNAEMQKSQGTASATSATIRQLSNEEERLAQAIRQSIGAGQQQSQVLSDLRSMMMQYLSVYGAQQFVKEMANITGELELQKKSLEVIIDNASTANQLYGQIRDLSQMSPYTFMDLLKTTRQLSAFSIETKDLYPTMKALSDIGAGLSVDVSRLILAFGHVRAYGYLSGIQNRQFETAGIDLMGELVKYYNKQADEERRKGNSAEYVNRKMLYGRMRKREIPFEDVQNVILGLDEPGGKFYNMQIRQFDTLGGKLRNLRNNYNIMMSEMGENNMGILSTGVSAINELTENWRTYYKIVMDVVWGLGAAKVAMIAYNAVMGKQATATYGALMAQVNRESFQRSQVGAINNMWAYRSPVNGKLRYELGSAGYGAKGLLASQVAEIASSKELTATQKMQIALRNNLSKAARAQILASAGVNAATIKEINTMSEYNRTMLRVQLSLRMFKAEMKAAFMAMAANPMTWIFAAVAGITALVQRSNELKATAERLTQEMRESAETDMKGINDFMSGYNSAITKNARGEAMNINGTSVQPFDLVFDENAIRDMGVTTVLEELKRRLQAMSPLYEGDLFDMHQFGTDIEQIEEGFRRLQSINLAKQVEQANPEGISQANKDSGNIVNDTFTENMKDYSDYMMELRNQIRKVNTATYNKIGEDRRQEIQQLKASLGLATDQDALLEYVLRNPYANTRGAGTNPHLDAGSLQALLGTRDIYNDFFGNGLKDAEKQLRGDAIKMAEAFAVDFQTYFKDDSNAAMVYFQDWMNKLFSAAKVGDPAIQSRISNMVMEYVRENLPQNMREQFTDNYFKKNVGVYFEKLVSNQISSTTSESDLQDIFEKSWKQALAYGKSLGYDMERLGLDHAEAYRKGFDAVRADKEYKNDWQRRAEGYFAASTQVRMQIDLATDYNDFWDKVRKMYKEAQDFMKQNKAQLAAYFNISPTLFLDADKLRSQYIELKKQANELIKNGMLFSDSDMIREGEKLLSDIDEMLKPAVDMATRIQEIEKGAKAEHQSLTDLTKNKGHKAYKDPEAERWREYIRLIKDAYDWYDKWEKKIGHDAALEKVKERYTGLISEEDLQSIDNYRALIERVRDAADKRYKEQKGKKKFDNGKQALAVYREAVKLLTDMDFDELTRESERWVSSMSKGMDDMTRKWDIFNNVRNTTGDRNLAMKLAGFDTTNQNSQSTADNLKSIIKSQIGLMGEEVKIPIEFDANKSDKDIQDMFQSAIGASTAYRGQIDGLVAEYKKWRDLQKEIEKSDIDVFAKLIASVSSYTQKMKNINAEYEKQMESIERLRKQYVETNGEEGISDSEGKRAESIAATRRDLSLMELRPEVQNFYNSIQTMNRRLALSIANELSTAYRTAFEQGNISADEYSEKMKKVMDGLNETRSWESNRSIYERIGGLFFNPRSQENQSSMAAAATTVRGQIEQEQAKGDQADQNLIDVLRRLEQALNNAIWGVGGMSERRAAAEYGQTVQDWGNLSPEEKEKKGGKAKKEKEDKDNDDKDISKFKKFTDDFARGLQKTLDVLGDFQKGLDFASGFFDSLGMEGAANAAGDAAGVLGGAMQGASALSGLGSWGMAAGAGLGLISGLAQVHDKRLERQIEKLRQEVTSIENNTALILQARERELGYDSGHTRQSYADQYIHREQIGKYDNNFWLKNSRLNKGFNSAAEEAMYKYYNENSSGNGYEQQLANLRSEREKYMDMYNAENSKKKTSQSALEEYKKKIAELDDQIHYFTVDLANELWGIDLKSWAQQLSDALATAFENGTDMAKAYKEAVTSILQSLASKMMQLAIIEPMMDRLQTKLFGIKDKNGNWSGGVFNIDDPTGSAKKVTDAISDFFGTNGEGQKAITAAQQFLTAFEQGVENAGLSLYNKDQTTLSNGISGASEETTSLLAAYVNALRQDVAVKRILLTQFVAEYWPAYIQQITGIHTTLQNIDQNVAVISALLSENGDLYSLIDQINNHLERFSTGIEEVHMA